MIIVTVKLHSARNGEISQLARIRLWNDGTGTQERGNYHWEIRGKGNRFMKNGELKNWPRKSKTALALLQKVINVSYPKGAK